MVLSRQRVGGVLCQSGQSQGEHQIFWRLSVARAKVPDVVAVSQVISGLWSLEFHM